MSDIGFTFDFVPVARWALALVMIVAGVMHFVKPRFYLRIMPPYVPFHRACVFWSGVAEVLLGIALLAPAARPWSAYGLIALFIAVFPANVHMALHAKALRVPSWIGWGRLPLQAVFIAWAWWVR
jgi:uncharacterized membrane protein